MRMIIGILVLSLSASTAFASCLDGKGPRGWFREGGYCSYALGAADFVAQQHESHEKLPVEYQPPYLIGDQLVDEAYMQTHNPQTPTVNTQFGPVPGTIPPPTARHPLACNSEGQCSYY